MIVAVTGATGFVGSNLVRELLLQGHTVRALVHSPEPPPSLSDLALGQQASPPQLTFHRGDILDPGSLQRVFAGSEVVFHLAARISITRHDSEAVLRTNVEGPRNVAAACLESGVRRLVHFSSVHAMHVPPRDEPMDESTPLVADERAGGSRADSSRLSVQCHSVGHHGKCYAGDWKGRLQLLSFTDRSDRRTRYPIGQSV